MLRILSNIIDKNIQNYIRIAAIQHKIYVYFFIFNLLTQASAAYPF